MQGVRLPVIAGAVLANRKPVTYRGITYASITGLACAFGLRPEQVVDRLKRNLPLEVRKPPRRIRLRPTAQEFWKTESR